MMRARVTIPNDCLKLIFRKLNQKKDQDSFGLTCHNFLDIQNYCCKHLDFNSSYSNKDYVKLHDSSIRMSNRFDHLQLSSSAASCVPSSLASCVSPSLSRCVSPSVTSHDKLIRLLNRFNHLESLSLTNNSDTLLDSGLKNLRKYLCRLHSIDLSDCSYLTDKGLTSVASSCPLLFVIRLCGCKITDKGLKLLTKFCKSLKQVDLSRCSKITDTGIGYLHQNCRELRALRISGCNKIQGVGFHGFSRSLVSLDAEGCKFYPSGVAAIFRRGGLEYLNLSFKTSEAIDFGSNGVNIKVLNIGNTYVNNDVIMSIAKGCPLLQEWNLSCCENIDISGWKSIGLYCQNLMTIHVNKRCFDTYEDSDEDFDDQMTTCFIELSRCVRLSVIYMCGWRSYHNFISPEILNVMREDMKIVIENTSVSMNTISWDNWDFTNDSKLRE